MAQDKYTAVWVSHSSISDWLACPLAYFYKNVYKDKKTGHKIALIAPPLSTGQAIHEVIESLSTLATDRRFKVSLLDKLDTAWKKIAGKRGGFESEEQEGEYKNKAREMLKKVTANPGPLKNLAVKIKMELPHYWLSEEDNIILCGKIDWLEYDKDSDSVHIIDFKTGRWEESKDSLQLPIYYLLASNTQSRKVAKMSYWYLASSDEPAEKKMPEMKKAKEKILKIAKEMKLARTLNRFKCPHGGCRNCKEMEKIINGEAEFVGVDEMRRDVYILPKNDKESGSEIL